MSLIKTFTDVTDNAISVISAKNNQCNQCKGFTFVELFVVVTIFSLLSLAVYATFGSGMRMWQRIQDTTFIQRKVLLEFERISADLRRALDFYKPDIPDIKEIGFSGKSSEDEAYIVFPILLNEEIIKVTYWWKRNSLSLYRKLESFKDILENKEQAKIRNLLSGIESLKFDFAFREEGKEGYSWTVGWDKAAGIPVIVKIELKTKDANFSKSVTIPIS